MVGEKWLLRGILFISSQVYLPCVLQTKKRYVGYMYETLDQKDPVFDAKGRHDIFLNV